MTYTFTYTELRQLLGLTLDIFTQQDGVYDFSEGSQAGTIAIEETIKAIEEDTKRRENSLPLVDEDEPSIHPDDIPFIMQDLIPFDGLAYESDDNISETEVGLLPKW